MGTCCKKEIPPFKAKADPLLHKTHCSGQHIQTIKGCGSITTINESFKHGSDSGVSPEFKL